MFIFEEALQNINKTDYFSKRGFSERIINKFKLGYLPYGLSNYYALLGINKKILSCYRYVIPDFNTDDEINYLILRADSDIMQNVMKFEIDKTYILGETNKAGSEIWNAKILQDTSLSEIFITETWPDALSIIQCGFNAIALNRAVNITRLWELLYNSVHRYTFILACDADFYGRKNNLNLVNMLSSLNYNYRLLNNFPEGIKDCNEWFIINSEEFYHALTEA